MPTIPEALALAVEHHRAGRLDVAGAVYRRILEVDARNIDALHLLGLVERAAGNAAAAVDLIGRAIAAGAGFAEIFGNYGNALLAAGETDRAAAAHRRALALAPGSAAACRNLGGLLRGRGGPGDWPEAAAVLGRAIRLEPGHADTHHDLGLALRQADRVDEAVDAYTRALAIRADFPAAHMSLGNARLEQGRVERSVAAFRRGLALMPAGPELYYNLGNALHAGGRGEEALAAYRRAARLGLHNGLVRAGTVLRLLGRPAEAEAELRQALAHPRVEVENALDMLADIMAGNGRTTDARAFFTDLMERPLGDGRTHPGECLTALASLDLHEGRPQDAAARLVRVRGDSSRFFTIKSLAALDSTLEALGVRLTRTPNPDPSRPRLTSSTLATHGRFAHNALEYVLIRLYAESRGCVLETPDWVGGRFFDLDDPPQSGPLAPMNFPRRILNDLLTGQGNHAPVADRDILSPLFLYEHREEWRERVQSWLKPRPVWRPFLDPAMQRLRELGDTVVAIHIRRGDFVQYRYPITETAWYVDWLRALWPTLARPVLYLASDDLAGVKADFAEFAPVALPDVIRPWPGLEYLQDFHVLSRADVVGISASSGFSLLAARLNTTARIFAEPDVRARRIRPLEPWTR